ncbi:S66 peptidase family protein [Clostridium luticellarii]|uniref:Putative murein peptide carboxypeptidase n=1 Tax=Clostridium luticellarii TaxID=1691940 RepID=A0A2T0B424_9CLOT|nr:LD-carboxypeptidase [Clostridium luticellarii]MCI1944882.1 LD-carboxypeptidase [Clostridium luticellarii]MCI1968442.1 LD-carboxypeptidase [Clostridium luticellarii]MCI1995440.1 LD-carboxypeptidase [Clostridium luticellarii]MCI2039503.1 LD-carboxypeptidase [Clostridium luticellarii]PRR78640.1 putative murein peptide carboxypeptidase [Clostridium luticellarii]
MLGKRLKNGDTIGIISPSGAWEPEKIKKSIKFLNDLGFKIKEGKHIYDRWGYLAGKDIDRAQDLMDMFLDPEVDMILCTRGGYGTMRLADLIDFDIIKRNPKIFAGFSDITVLLNSIFEKCGIITFHSPMCNTDFDDFTLKSFLDTLMLGYNPFTIENPKNIPTYYFNGEYTSGKLVGGNLSLICSLLGTPYAINTENKILFIEDVGEEPYRIDRMLTQLTLSGDLQKCKGFIMGQFKNCQLPHYERSLTLTEILEDRILSLKKPTLINFQSGHSYPRITLPIGADVEVNFKEGKVNLLDPVVK